MSTVSRVLNRSPNVRAATRSRVEEAIAALRYRPSRVARRLRVRGGRAHMLGLIIPEIQNPFFAEIARGVEDVARDRGYAVILCNSDENLDREQLYIDLLRAESVDGVILPPIHGDAKTARRLASLGLPVVCLDRRLSSLVVDTVVVDNRQGAYDAVAHLIDMGNRRIGILTGPLNLSTSLERLQGYKHALADHGIAIDERLIRTGPPHREDGRAMASAMLSLDAPPTAFFTHNPLLALGAFEASRDRGLRIPDDIGVVGFDDAPWADLLDPPLSSVRQPSYELGRRAAELLFDRLTAPDRPPALVVLPPTLVVRRSSGAHRDAA